MIKKKIRWRCVSLYSSENKEPRALTGFGHSDTAVDDRESVARLVWYNMNEELRLRIELALVG